MTRPAVVISDAPIVDEEVCAPPPADDPVVEADAAAGVVDEDGDLEEGLPARAITHDDGSITLPLRYPVSLQIRSARSGQVRTDTFATLTFHRLRGADIRAITAASSEAQPAALLARSARIKEPVAARLFDLMDASDIRDMSAVATHFFGPGRKTPR